jgi:hypothetical protein
LLLKERKWQKINILAGKFWREIFGKKFLAGNFWREIFVGNFGRTFFGGKFFGGKTTLIVFILFFSY